MKEKLGIFALFCISAVAAEIVYLQDTNNDLDKRNLDFGLPENLQFRLVHSGNDVKLNLRENKRLNANAPIYEPGLDGKVVRNTKVQPNNRVRYYQDIQNGAFMTAECMKRQNGPCTRLLTGNLVLNGKEHKLEPAMDELNKRELPSHLGTPHTMEVITSEFSLGGISDHEHGGKVVTAHKRDDFIDYVTHDPETTTYSTTTEDYDLDETEEELEEERKLANKFLLEKLLQRLNRQKRSPEAHGVEMLLAIDHAVYDDFAARFNGDEVIKYKIREYYSHVINGVDLRYASIQEDDISLYVTISGFFISNSVTTSPWLDYSQNPTDGSAGLVYMRTWITTDGLPVHDHAAFITGTNIQSGGSSGVVGIAYLNGVCNSYRVSINEEYGLFKGSGVLAHELGHNLGAPHDLGATGSGCNQDDDYVMAPYVPYLSASSSGINPWRFSSCSVDSFRNYFSSLSFDCTLNRAVIWDENEFEKHTAGLAGQLYSVEEQCVLLRGEGSTFCGSNLLTPDICRNMRCQSPSGSCSRYVAAHGTPCGNNLMCFEGLCNEPIDTTPAPTTPAPTTPAPTTPGPTLPPSGYSCADTAFEGQSCSDIKTLMGNSLKMCRRFFGQCCQYCYSNKGCKKDRKVAGASKYDCATLIASLGLQTTCTMFPFDCCKSCEELAVSK